MALIYEPLDIDSYEVRLLNILPDPPESPVRCTLEKTSLLEPIPYTALSYCWGNADITTEIFLNGFKTPVTTNLAHALRQLRKIGVDRLWIDAVCINQKDTQEKGLQIQNMMEIFSRADRSYGWLGCDDDSGTIAGAIVFLESLLNSLDGIALGQTTHTCVLTTQQQKRMSLVQHSPSHNGLGNGSCTYCANESHFQGLRHFLQREHWRRRWIIQETSVPYEVIIFCGDAAMALDEIIVAIDKCQKSFYWNSDMDDVYSCFQSIANFRRLFQEGSRLSLGKALTLTRNFQSSHPRDAIFSLLGPSEDGSGLVPTPNYLQPIERIVASLTIAHIQKHKHLDYILLNRRMRIDPEGYPSWSPNWLSKDLSLHDPREGGFKSQSCFGKSVGRFSFTNGTILQVKGLTVGKILAITTTSTDLTDVNSLHSSQTNGPTPFVVTSNYVNYTMQEVLSALLSCFTITHENEHVLFSDTKYSHLRFFGKDNRVPWRSFCRQCVHPSRPGAIQPNHGSVNFETPELQSTRVFAQWLKANAGFRIHGRTLEEWTQERSGYHGFLALLRVLDYPPVYICVSVISGLLYLVNSWFLGLIFPPIFLCIDLISENKLSPVWCGVMILLSIITCYISGVIFRFLFEHHEYGLRNKQPEWYDLTQLVKPGKKLFVTDKGFVGLADDGAMNGDVLCYLVGCSAAVVLRKIEGERIAGDDEDAGRDGGSDDMRVTSQRKNYKVVGECYIHLREKDSINYLGPPWYIRKEDWLKNLPLRDFCLV